MAYLLYGVRSRHPFLCVMKAEGCIKFRDLVFISHGLTELKVSNHRKKKKAVSKIAAGSNGENLPELYLCFFQDIILFTSLDLIHSLCLRQFKQNFCLVQIKVSMHKIASIVFIGAPYYMLTALLIAVQDVW